jgi:predicted RND superfamily exporter protein
MQSGAALLQDARRLMADDGFTLSILAVVAVGTALAFGFDGTRDIIAPLLILGVMTALAERKLRAKK